MTTDDPVEAPWEALIVELDDPQPGMTSWGSIGRHRPLIEAALRAQALSESESHRLFHGHHPACPYTIEGDWSLCDCGAQAPILSSSTMSSDRDMQAVADEAMHAQHRGTVVNLTVDPVTREKLATALALVGIVESDQTEQYRLDYATTDQLLRVLAERGLTLRSAVPSREDGLRALATDAFLRLFPSSEGGPSYANDRLYQRLGATLGLFADSSEVAAALDPTTEETA